MVDNINVPQDLIKLDLNNLTRVITDLLNRVRILEKANKDLEARVRELESGP